MFLQQMIEMIVTAIPTQQQKGRQIAVMMQQMQHAARAAATAGCSEDAEPVVEPHLSVVPEEEVVHFGPPQSMRPKEIPLRVAVEPSEL